MKTKERDTHKERDNRMNNDSKNRKSLFIIVGMHSIQQTKNGKTVYIGAAIARGVHGRGGFGSNDEPTDYIRRFTSTSKPTFAPMIEVLLDSIKMMCKETGYAVEIHSNCNTLLQAFESGELEDYGRTGALRTADGRQMTRIPKYLSECGTALAELYRVCDEKRVLFHITKSFLSSSEDGVAERYVLSHMEEISTSFACQQGPENKRNGESREEEKINVGLHRELCAGSRA